MNVYFFKQPTKKTEISKIPSPRPLADILDKTRGTSKIPQARRRNSRTGIGEAEEGKYRGYFSFDSSYGCILRPRIRRTQGPQLLPVCYQAPIIYIHQSSPVLIHNILDHYLNRHI